MLRPPDGVFDRATLSTMARERALFSPVVPEARLHPSFQAVLASPAHVPSRELMQDVFESMPEQDGNFIKDFQTTGFDARVWELYLYAWGSRSGHYTVHRPHDRPDFRFTSVDLRTTWIEAVIAGQAPDDTLPHIPDQDDPGYVEAVRRRSHHFVPIRLGSPLFSKLQKRYWDLDWVHGLPLVFAIADFHDPSPFRDGGHILAQYLYGVRDVVRSGPGEPLRRTLQPMEDHHVPPKPPVPAGFFNQPGAENVSAVLFSNSGTVPKFMRMGFDPHRHPFMRAVRFGARYRPDPDSIHPRAFAYLLGDQFEGWGDGMEVLPNPRARVPLPTGFFPDAALTCLGPDGFESQIPGGHALWSTTETFVHLERLGPSPDDTLRAHARQVEAFLDHVDEQSDAVIRSVLK